MLAPAIRTLMGACALFTLVSCQSSSTSTSPEEQDDFLSDVTQTLDSRLLTGENATFSASFWQCKIKSSGEMSSIQLRFWRDGSGFAGSRAMKWSVLDETDVTLQFEDSKTTLNQLQITGFDEKATFDTFDGYGNKMNCAWSGPLLNAIDDTLLADETQGLEQMVTGTGAMKDTYVWSCTFKGEGAVIGQLLEFFTDRTGSVDGVESKWAIDDRFRLSISTEQEMIYLHEIRFTGAGNATFLAKSESREAICRR